MNNRRLICSLLALSCALGACDYMPSWMGGKKPDIERLPGERTTVLPIGSELQPDDALKQVAFVLPAPNENTSWPQHTGNFTSATANLAAKGTFEHSDSASIGDGNDFEQMQIPRPVIGGGLVYAMDAEGKISAHDAANISAVRWTSSGVSEKDDSDVNGGGLAFEQGRVYAVSGRGVAVAIDAQSGAVIWRKAGHSPFRSAPIVSAGKLFATTIDSQLIAFDAQSGEAAWDHRGIDETAGFLNSVAPAVSGNVAVIPYESGELYALSVSDGRELWNTSLALGKRTQASSIFAGIGGDPVIDNDVVFAVSSGGMFAVYGLAQGQRLWERAVSSINTPWVVGDYVFMLTSENMLVAFVKYDGRVRWVAQLPNFENMKDKRNPIFWRGPIMVEGKLAVVNSDGEMKLFAAADGKELADVSIPSNVYTAPIVAGGRMYMVTKDAKLHVLY